MANFRQQFASIMSAAYAWASEFDSASRPNAKRQEMDDAFAVVEAHLAALRRDSETLGKWREALLPIATAIDAGMRANDRAALTELTLDAIEALGALFFPATKD